MLQARLCRSAARRAWDEFNGRFTENAQLRVYGVNGALDCFAFGSEIGHVINARLGSGQLTVRAGCEELTVLSATRAEGIWAVEYFVPPSGKRGGLHGIAELHQTYEQHSGRWLIRSVDLTHPILEARILPT
ncbi:hypothetical protein E4M00_03000 [Leifsonia flava]|uniref:SnoaL-like domain-containing protein n=2 Tax=Orlajensenia leifsoniae TaxID=2561933 RepID=A0A4Y9R6J0_9MICO|nr:hypothetical protein E4M00_03000 [Leifsonia flava]